MFPLAMIKLQFPKMIHYEHGEQWMPITQIMYVHFTMLYPWAWWVVYGKSFCKRSHVNKHGPGAGMVVTDPLLQGYTDPTGWQQYSTPPTAVIQAYNSEIIRTIIKLSLTLYTQIEIYEINHYNIKTSAESKMYRSLKQYKWLMIAKSMWVYGRKLIPRRQPGRPWPVIQSPSLGACRLPLTQEALEDEDGIQTAFYLFVFMNEKPNICTEASSGCCSTGPCGQNTAGDFD